MMIVRFHRLAIKDFERAYRWYARKNAHAAERLRDAVLAAVGRIRDYPTLAPGERGARTLGESEALPLFALLRLRSPPRYSLDLAVAHARRRLGYWRSRSRRP
jgi:plasmid stabilization system protein ParE